MELLIALFTLVTLHFVTGMIMDPQMVHSTSFDETKESKKLAGYVFATISSTPKTKCALACSKSVICFSFNFCSDQTCELNSEDIYSTQEGDELLLDDANCMYFGMSRRSAPVCFENGQVVTSTNGRNLECNIVAKQVDREWSSWGEQITEIDSTAELKIVQKRFIILEAAHGGNKGLASLLIFHFQWSFTLNWSLKNLFFLL